MISDEELALVAIALGSDDGRYRFLAPEMRAPWPCRSGIDLLLCDCSR